MMDARAPLSIGGRLRYDIIRRLLRPLTDATSFLEIGCGQGAMATIFASRYNYLGYEPDAESFHVAEGRLRRTGHGQVIMAPLPAEPDHAYDIVAAFEVLEHMQDDAAALRAWVTWIRPGGHLLVSSPANPNRFGPEDEYAGHYRRYTRDGLSQLLREAGMTNVEVHCYGFPLTNVLEWVRNQILKRRLKAAPTSLDERTSASGRSLQLAGRVPFLIWLATAPFRYLQRPFSGMDLGTGYVVRAERPVVGDPS